MRLSIRLLASTLVLFVIGFSGLAMAQEISSSAGSSYASEKGRGSSKARVSEWLQAAGLSPEAGGFAGDFFHLVAGVDHPVGDSMTMTFSAGSGLRMGLTF